MKLHHWSCFSHKHLLLHDGRPMFIISPFSLARKAIDLKNVCFNLLCRLDFTYLACGSTHIITTTSSPSFVLRSFKHHLLKGFVVSKIWATLSPQVTTESVHINPYVRNLLAWSFWCIWFTFREFNVFFFRITIGSMCNDLLPSTILLVTLDENKRQWLPNYLILC